MKMEMELKKDDQKAFELFKNQPKANIQME
jgi:hypothetical protein